MDNQKPKSFLDDLAHEKPESFKEEVFIRQKKSYIPTLITAALIIVVATFLFILFSKGSTVVDMNGWSEAEVNTWANSNHVTIIKEEVHSLTQPVGTVLLQNLVPGSKLKRNGNLAVTYSLGPDPNEVISFPDLKTLSLSQLNQWIEDNKLTGISIKKENNSVFPKDSIINYEFVDGSENDFLRKNRVKIYVSLGSEELTDTITIPDLIGQDKGSIVKWADKNKISISFEEAFNEYVEYGKAATQSIDGNTKMKRDDTLIITLSLGKEIIVPDFLGSTRQEASDLATFRGFQVHFKNQISSKDEGTLLEQDIEAGTIIHAKQLVTITVASSSDQVKVPNLIGLSSSEASSLASIYEIKTFFVTKSSIEKEGTVIEQSSNPNSSISKDTLVTVYVSNGDIVMPDFEGVSKDEAELICSQLDIKVTFNTFPDSTSINNTVLKQNITTGKLTSKSDHLVLSISSNNGVLIPDFSKSSRSQIEQWSSLHDTAITIIEKYSDKIPVGNLFDQNITNSYLPSNENLFIYQSLGQIFVNDFIGQSKLEVITWQKEVNTKGANININFLNASNTTKQAGTVVNQDIKLDTIKTNSTLDVWIASSSNANQIPDMTNVTETIFIEWCEKNSIAYQIVEYYSDIYKVDKLFNQNYLNQYMPAGETLRIYKSIGKVRIGNFASRSLEDIEAWKNEVNLQGANINFAYSYSPDHIQSSNAIISLSHSNVTVPIGTIINITLPTPKGIIVPQLIGKQSSQAFDLLNSLGIQYSITYMAYNGENENSFTENSIIHQSINAGEKIEKGTIIKLIISKDN